MNCYWDNPDTYSHHIVAFGEYYDCEYSRCPYEPSCSADYHCFCPDCCAWYGDQEVNVTHYWDWLSATDHLDAYLNHQYNWVIQTVVDERIPF